MSQWNLLCIAIQCKSFASIQHPCNQYCYTMHSRQCHIRFGVLEFDNRNTRSSQRCDLMHSSCQATIDIDIAQQVSVIELLLSNQHQPHKHAIANTLFFKMPVSCATTPLRVPARFSIVKQRSISPSFKQNPLADEPNRCNLGLNPDAFIVVIKRAANQPTNQRINQPAIQSVSYWYTYVEIPLA
jgi:hypothetical protein